VLLAHRFGRTAATDGFLAAYGVYLVLILAAQAFRMVVVPELTRAAAAGKLGCVVSVTGAVDHVSDGERMIAVANGHELLAAVTGTGCMSSAITGCFVAVKGDAPLEAAAEALAAFGVAGEDAATGAKGPGSYHVGLYDALANLDPDTLDSRARIS